MTGTLDIDLSTPTCRICLQNNESERPMSPIFPQSGSGQEDTSICEKINMCTGIKIQKHEKLPSFICMTCMTFLNIAYRFASICHSSHNYLQKYVFELPSVKHDTDATTDCGQMPTQEQDEELHPSNSHDGMQEYVVEEIELSDTKSNSLKRQLIKDESRSSATQHSEELSEDYYDECWLEGEESTNKISDVKSRLTNLPEEGSLAKDGTNNSNANTPSKILGISSDGAAVIEDKTLKSDKKGKKPHICDICGNVYDRRYALLAHIRRHRDEKPFECEICGQAFHCNFELSRHIRKHSGIRPYLCEYCKRTFGDRSTLMKHERIHRNERPYACETCGKSFTYASVLKVHQLTHTGEKNYNCELCGKRFSRAHHLRAHLETLLHQNDPRSKVLLKQIKRTEEGLHLGSEILTSS